MDMTKHAGEWVNPEAISGDTKNPTKAKILNAGEPQEDEQYGKSVVFKIEIDGKELSYRPNKTSIRAIIARHGAQSEGWVGKEIGLAAIQQVVNGKMKKVIFAS